MIGKILVVFSVILVIILFILAFTKLKSRGDKSDIVPSPSPTAVSSPVPAKVSKVNIYLVAIDDQGKSGEKIGCGDSVVSVTRQITPTTMPLTAAITELLSIREKYYGESGLYNALYQSKLNLVNAKVENGVATINISGTLTLAGECDNPRVEAQLTKTALQFSTVKTLDISINNLPLKEALSLK